MTESALAAQFVDLLGLVEAQRASGERGGATVTVGTATIELTAPSIVLPQVVEPIAHATFSPTVESAIASVHVVFRDEDFARRVPRRWDWTTQRRTDGRYDFRLEYVNRGLLAVDAARRTAVLILEEESTRAWVRPEYSRPILERVLSWLGWVSVHGGTIGDGLECVLIAAAGGQGKSSLVAGGVRRGFQTVGDDFLFLEPGTATRPPLLHALFRTVKLARDSPAWEPRMAVGSQGDGVDGKFLTDLEDIRSGCVARTQRPVAIVVPRAGAAVDCSDISVTEALAALLPSSVTMASDPRAAVPALVALVESLPCYRLTLANDPEAEIRLLIGVLERHRSLGDGPDQ
jgi:hypothetical protein